MIRFYAVALGVIASWASGATAVAEPAISAEGGRRIAVETPSHAYTTVAPAGTVSPVIYLERCKGTGCTIHGATLNDARTYSTTIPNPGTYLIGEFLNAAAQGDPAKKDAAATETEWAALVQCVKEVYSPFDVQITDVRPSTGFHMAIVAGKPADVGLGADVLGVAPLASDCSAQDNVMSFSFANIHPGDANSRMLNLCWTVAQESAHAFGLDHEFLFTTNVSACSDPMTYRTDCGGEKFFRNIDAKCGEFSARACRCGATQNSHQKVLSVFGGGIPITGAPTVSITTPTTDGGAMPGIIISQASAKRGVARVELILNGHKWAEAKGVPFGSAGQPAASYGINVPTGIPNGNYDIVARAFDDLEISTDSPVRTALKGSPCVTADTCLVGQKCEAGKCFWDPPVGELGESCTYNEFCKTNLCTGTKEQTICTQSCIPGAENACPNGLACVETSVSQGVCFFDDSGGCCSASDAGPSRVLFQAGMAVLLVGFVVRRRTRRGSN